MAQLFSNIKDKLIPNRNYQSNLLGESLEVLLKKATNKSLLSPDDVANTAVASAINQEVSQGTPGQQIVGMIKKRLRMDNPHKQYLAIVMLGKLLRDCPGLGPHQDELLMEVARVIGRYPRGQLPTIVPARNAAMELLRSFGRAGATALNNARRTGATDPDTGGYAYAQHTHGQAGMHPETMGGMVDPVQVASVAEEIRRIIDQGKASAELLSEMLCNATDNGSSHGDFESELMGSLGAELLEMRSMLTVYLEQLGPMEGPESEVLMMEALEAADAMDMALALQQDVSTVPQNLAGDQPGPSEPQAGPSHTIVTHDLISLDDDTPTAMISSPPHPGFSAASPHPPPSQPIAMAPQNDAFSQLAAAGTPPMGSPPPYASPQPYAMPPAMQPYHSMPQQQPMGPYVPPIQPVAPGAYGPPTVGISMYDMQQPMSIGGPMAPAAGMGPLPTSANNPFASPPQHSPMNSPPLSPPRMASPPVNPHNPFAQTNAGGPSQWTTF